MEVQKERADLTPPLSPNNKTGGKPALREVLVGKGEAENLQCFKSGP